MIRVFSVFAVCVLLAARAFATEPSTSGEELFASNCLACHDGGAPKAPHVVMLQVMSPESVLDAMTAGVMKAQSAHLSEADKLAIAEFLGGRPVSDTPLAVTNFCPSDLPRNTSEHSVVSWGMGDTNPRSVPGNVSGISLAKRHLIITAVGLCISGRHPCALANQPCIRALFTPVRKPVLCMPLI